MEPKTKYFLTGISSTILIILAMGIPTALVPNPFFHRMIDVTILDYVFLFGTSMLLGLFVSISLYKRSTKGKENYLAAGGGILGVFAFACPLCNVLLVSVLGASLVSSFFVPFGTWLGVLGIAILSFAVLQKFRCKGCKR